MTLANEISRQTANYDPAIERHDDGSLTFQWPIRQRGNWRLTITRLCSVTGIEPELFSKSLIRGLICLHLPEGIA